MGKHGKYRPLVGAVLAAALATWGGPGAAAPCRLALALAIDVSSSVDAREDALQRNGLAAALVAPDVMRAFLAAPGPVALSVFEWSSRADQTVLVDWRLIRGAADLHAVAARISGSVRSSEVAATAMGHALAFGSRMLERAPDCARHVIDLAGDGENNDGYGPRLAYKNFAFSGVVVNGLAINGADYEAEIRLIDFFRTEVLRGPGAFLEIAQGFEDYERAMRRKLERELTGPVAGIPPGTAPGAPG